MTRRPGLVALYLCWSMLLAVGAGEDSHRLPRVLADGPRQPIDVARGRRANLSRWRHLGVNQAALDGTCKVEVDGSDSLSQTVGQLKPKTFDCFFRDGDVIYEHEGSPFGRRDSVHLQVHYFFGKNNTLVVPLRLEVRINLSDGAFPGRRLILAGPAPLAVEGSGSRTLPIDSNSIRFAYNPLSERCTVEHRRGHGTFRRWPLFGRLLNDRGQLAREFRLDCHLFLLTAFKYEKTSTQTGLEFDYLPIAVQVLPFGSSGTETQFENFYLSVRLERANSAASAPLPLPKLQIGDSRRYSEMSHSGGLPAPLPKNLVGAGDVDLVVEVLELSIVAAPGLNASLVDIREPGSMALGAFELSDLRSGHIALQVLGVATTDRIEFRLRLRPLDAMLRAGPEVSLRLVSTVQHKRLQLFTSPMLVCTGGTALLRPHNLQSASWAENIRFRVKRDPYSGRLALNGAPFRSFSSRKLVRFWKFRIAYIHNGNLPRYDSIGLRAVFRGVRVSLQLPIHVIRNWDAVSSLKSQVSYRVSALGKFCIGKEIINESALKYLVADGVQLKYNVTQAPLAGVLTRSNGPEENAQRTRSVDSLTLADLFLRTLCYQNFHSPASQWDFIKLRQYGRPDLTELVIRVRVQPLRNVTLENKSTRLHTVTSVLETHRQGLQIGRDILQYATAGLPPKLVGYEVLLQPYFTSFGGNISLDAGRLIDSRRLISQSAVSRDISTLTQFTQEDVDNGYMRYVPPLNDVGQIGRAVDVILQPFDALHNRARQLKLSFFVQPVDNLRPQLQSCKTSQASAAAFSLVRGGHRTLDARHLTISDGDTGQERLELMLIRAPSSGRLMRADTTIEIGERLNMDQIRRRDVRYQHDGSLSDHDSFIVRATDGSNMGPECSINIDINEPLQPTPGQGTAVSQHQRQRQQEQPQGEEAGPTARTEHLPAEFINNTVFVPEGGNVRLSPLMLPRVRSESSSVRQTAYLVGTRPIRGEIALVSVGASAASSSSSSVSQFSHEDLSAGRVLYRHTGSEIGADPVTDTCQLYIYNGAEWLTHRLEFSIRPVDNKGPAVSEGSRVLVREGGRTALTVSLIRVVDPDTKADDLRLIVVEQPRHGEIRLKLPSGREISVREFTKRQLADGLVFLIQSRHCGVEHNNDTFKLQATDGQRRSPIVSVKVIIFPATDESPRLHLADFSLVNGESRVLDASLLYVSDADRPEEEVRLRIINLPKVGTLYMYWLSSGTTEIVTTDANRNFTMSELTNKIRLVYKQDHDVTSLLDTFSIEARDLVFRVVRKCRISIITSNELPPNLAEPLDRLQLRTGETIPVTERHLLVADRDTPKDNLTLSIVQLPDRAQLLLASTLLGWSRHSKLKLTPLRLGEKFTQRDVQLGRLFVSAPLEEDSGDTVAAIEQAQFVPEDGKFSASLARLEIKTLPLPQSETRAWLRLLTTPVGVEVGSTISITETNIMVKVFGPQPPPAVIQVVRPNSSCWMLHKKREVGSEPAPSEIALLSSDITAGHIVFNASNCSEQGDLVIKLKASWNDQQALARWLVRLLPPSPSLLPPRLVRSVPLSLSMNTAAIIGPDQLLIVAGDIASAREPKYRLVSSPKYGILMRTDNVELGPGEIFSQADLNSSTVTYQSTEAPLSGRDSFQFAIDDSAQVAQEMHTFIIVVKSRSAGDRRNVTILRATCPTELSGFSATGAGFRFSNRSLKAQPSSAVFLITRQPALGRLWLRDTSNITQFAQSDVNAGLLAYRFNEPRQDLDAVEDAFELMARDALDVRLVTERKLVRLAWSVVGFGQHRFRVRCLSSGTLRLDVIRSGALDRPAFVRFEITAGKERDRAHFTLISGNMLNFSPGERKARISIHISERGNDTQRVKLRITLVSPGNCLIGANSSVVVVLVNPTRETGADRQHAAKPGLSGRRRSGCGGHFEVSPSNDLTLFKEYLQYYARNRQLSDQPLEQPSQPEPVSSKQPSEKSLKAGKRPVVLSLPPTTADSRATAEIHVPTGNELKRLREDEQRIDYKDGRGFPRCSIYLSGEQRTDSTGQKYICNGATWVTMESVLASQSRGSKAQSEYVDKPITCPAGWTTMRGTSCVKYFRSRLTGAAAAAECAKFGARLAEIQSVTDLRWIREKLRSRKRYWIGLHRSSGGAWLQPSGQAATYQPWWPGSNHDKPGQSADSCAMVYRNRWLKSVNCGAEERAVIARRRQQRPKLAHYMCQLLVRLSNRLSDRREYYKYVLQSRRKQIT